MKKLLIATILLSMILFGSACGGSSKNEEQESNNDNTSEDPGEITDGDKDNKETTDEDNNDEDTNVDDGDTEEGKPNLTEEEKLESIKNFSYDYIHFTHGTGVVAAYGTDKPTSFALGVRNSNTKTALKPDDLFEIGGITRSFTAATILLLQEEGELSLDDKISKWFPNFKDGDKVSVKMLLNNTSGIKEVSDKVDPNQVLDAVNGSFNFEPGTAVAYTNSAYMIAGLIIEKVVTDKKAHEVIREKILDPLGLKNTFMKGYENYPADNEVTGHNFKPDGSVEPCNSENKTWTAGGMVSNAADLFKYADALFTGKIIKKESLDMMLPAENQPGLGVQMSEGTHQNKFYVIIGNALSANNLLNSNAVIAYYPDGMKHIVLNNFPDNKYLLVLNDEMDWVLLDNIRINKTADFPDWDKMIDHKETTQIFSIYALPPQNFNYGISYFAHPADQWQNYYCLHSLRFSFKQDEDGNFTQDIEKIVIAQDCQEPREYLNQNDLYAMQRTEISINAEDFMSAVTSKQPVSKFTVAKYNYFAKGGFVEKACVSLEDDGNEANKSVTILQDLETIQGVQTYRLWGKANMAESSKGCICFEKVEHEDDEGFDSRPIECPQE